MLRWAIIVAFAALMVTGFVYGRDLNDNEKGWASRQADSVGAEVDAGGLEKFADRTDQALNRVVLVALHQMDKKGQHAFATQKEQEWNTHFRGYLSHRYSAGYGDIGDHAPLVKWLADFYDKVEAKLGVTLCKMTHISDIKTFNFCIPVVFHPCTFDMGGVTLSRKDEYRNHFSQGLTYYGLLPVVTYWVADIGCMFGTVGIGALLCGPVAGLAEIACANTVAPKVSDRVFDRACGS